MSTFVESKFQYYKVDNYDNINIKDHVILSKLTQKCIKKLANIIQKEYWGSNLVLLYKYLDYTWKKQFINNNILKFSFDNKRNSLLFNTELFDKNNNNVFLILFPNYRFSYHNQLWTMLPNESIITKIDLINFHGFNEYEIPTIIKDVEYNDNEIFYKDYSFNMNILHRINSSKNRILWELNDKNININENYLLSTKFEKIVEKSLLNSFNLLKKNPLLIGKHLYMSKYMNNNRIELLMPLYLKINNKEICFAVVLRSDHINKIYEGVSILTIDMAYGNSRLIEPVKVSWLLKDYTCLCVPELMSDTTNVLKQIIFEPNIFDSNPFFYIATILPIQLPKLQL